MTTKPKTKDESDFLKEARDRLEKSIKAEQDNHEKALDDLGFLSGEDQWDADLKKEREDQGKPCLVINRLPQFVDQVTGDSRQNKPSIKVRPVDSVSDPKLAEIYNGIIRNISDQSQGDVARDTAQQSASECGFGAYRLLTEYSDSDTFEQDIKIERISNPFSVHFDPAAKKWDKSDGKYCFITDRISRKDLDDEYPDKANKITSFASADTGWHNSWIFEDEVLIAEYFVKEPVTKTLYLLSDGTTTDVEPPPRRQAMQPTPVMETPIDDTGPVDVPRGTLPENPFLQGQESTAPPMLSHEEISLGTMIANGTQGVKLPPPPLSKPEPESPYEVKRREVKTHKVLWYKLAGDVILDGPKELPGKLIPVIPVLGKEINIQGKTIYRGVIRHSKDVQRLYNYQRSVTAETLAYAPKSPFIGSPRMVEGYEDMWNSAHKKAWPILYCRPDPQFPGMMPQRIQPAPLPAALFQETMILSDEFKSTTGIYDPSLGNRSNETSGRAILARQREADTGTFPYIDNLSRAMQLEGRILIEWIPRIYDTDRIVRILGEDGKEDFKPINRPAIDAFGQPVVDADGNPVLINDLAAGKFDCVVTVGPSYATQRLESADSMIQFVQALPPAGAVIGDLVAESMDWPKSDVIAKRLKKIMPPGLADDDQQQGQPSMPPLQPPPQPPPDPTAEIKVQQEMERLKGLQLENMKKELEIRKLLGQAPPDVSIGDDGVAVVQQQQPEGPPQPFPFPPFQG